MSKVKLAFLSATTIACSVCNAAGGKQLYFLPPTYDSEWTFTVPMVSTDGKSGKAMKLEPDMCGWYTYTFAADELTDKTVIYSKDDPDNAFAVNDLKTRFNDTDTLYYIPEEDLRVNESGWTNKDPEVEGICQYAISAIIYDTDASLHGAFSCNPSWVGGMTDAEGQANACAYPAAPFQAVDATTGVFPCIGVTTGMVTETLEHNPGSANYKKPQLTSKGKACFGPQADEAFKAMFNSTAGVNETSCIDIPLTRTSTNRWEFDSDYSYNRNTSTVGGFHPVENAPDPALLLSDALPAARNKRLAEGPIYFAGYQDIKDSTNYEGLRTIDEKEGVPKIDLLCNTTSWDKGIDCAGFFKSGGEFADYNDEGEVRKKIIENALSVHYSSDIWGWSSIIPAPIGWTFYKDGSEMSAGTVQTPFQVPSGNPRWTSGTSDSEPSTTVGRNQHFCIESHAIFVYKEGGRFGVRGDDDIWVYIDNKLAVDLGGTHLPAPNYVDLDNFTGATGKLVPGNSYELDLYFCDRRTTMSNLRINTNLQLMQRSQSTMVKKVPSAEGGTTYELCYTKTGSQNCSAAMNGMEEVTACGSEITTQLGLTISYILVKGSQYDPMGETLDPATVPGIDLSNPGAPRIDKAKMVLPTGTWTLFVIIDGNAKKIMTFNDSSSIAAKTLAAPAFSIRAGDHKFTILASGSERASTYQLFNMKGKQVRQGMLTGASTEVTVPSNGTYIVRSGSHSEIVRIK